jgi:dTMP kinase
MPEPLFLSLDGIDGTGKSTQVRMLVEALRAGGATVTACVDPGGTELGAKLREILLHGRASAMDARTEALLFMASRAELVATVIRPALARGEVVVSDRFLLANVVYQGHAGGLDPEDLWEVGRFSTGGLSPDLAVVFDLPVEVARARRGRPTDRIESRGADYDERVRNGYFAEAHARTREIAIVDASGDAATVHAAVLARVRPLLAARGHPV